MEIVEAAIPADVHPASLQSTATILSLEQGGSTATVEAEETPSLTAAEGSKKRKNEDDETPAKSKRHPMWKTSLCSFFRRNGKPCSHGEACRYAHGEAELLPRPDKSWDPTSERAKKIKCEEEASAALEEDPPITLDETSLDKCLVGLPMRWDSDKIRSFLNDLHISFKSAKKKKGMTLGFMSFENAEQVKTAVQVLNENPIGGKQIKIADAVRRSYGKNSTKEISVEQRENHTENHSGSADAGLISSSLNENDATVDKDTSVLEGLVSKSRSARDAVTPLAHMPYIDQLEHKKSSLLKILKRLAKNVRKACPDAVPLPDWITKCREIAGLPCKFEGILESPLINGYRNKCEFSVGYSLLGKRTVGFTLGNFREGVTAVEEPDNCPNISSIACDFASIFQEFLQSSALSVWNRIDNTGFWRQLTVREGRISSQTAMVELETYERRVAEVMLIIQVCSTGVDEELMNNEFEKMVQALRQGAAVCSPPLPLTTVVIQDHKGISNVAPADCPLIVLGVLKEDGCSSSEKPYVTEARIHDHINNLRFCISPTAFFQVNTLAAERLYSLAGDWADLTPDTLLFDICCGTGTIGLTLAHRVGMVVGIEMNDSAVSDALRNAEINGIKNSRFVCGKAEDVMGALLKEYLGAPQQHYQFPDLSGVRSIGNDPNIINDDGDEEMVQDTSVFDSLEEVANEKILGGREEKTCGSTKIGVTSTDSNTENGANGSAHTIVGSSSGVPINCIPVPKETNGKNSEVRDTSQENGSPEDENGTYSGMQQFKDVVTIVDPPRVGLHPVVIKALRTHPRIRRLVYISCNPESLVANAIELCTPTTENPEKGQGNRAWRKMSGAGLARHRAKSMPNSEPFRPVKAMAVDLFPHTTHCEMVMLFER